MHICQDEIVAFLMLLPGLRFAAIKLRLWWAGPQIRIPLASRASCQKETSDAIQ